MTDYNPTFVGRHAHYGEPQSSPQTPPFECLTPVLGRHATLCLTNVDALALPPPAHHTFGAYGESITSTTGSGQPSLADGTGPDKDDDDETVLISDLDDDGMDHDDSSEQTTLVILQQTDSSPHIEARLPQPRYQRPRSNSNRIHRAALRSQAPPAAPHSRAERGVPPPQHFGPLPPRLQGPNSHVDTADPAEIDHAFQMLLNIGQERPSSRPSVRGHDPLFQGLPLFHGPPVVETTGVSRGLIQRTSTSTSEPPAQQQQGQQQQQRHTDVPQTSSSHLQLGSGRRTTRSTTTTAGRASGARLLHHPSIGGAAPHVSPLSTRMARRVQSPALGIVLTRPTPEIAAAGYRPVVRRGLGGLSARGARYDTRDGAGDGVVMPVGHAVESIEPEGGAETETEAVGVQMVDESGDVEHGVKEDSGMDTKSGSA